MVTIKSFPVKKNLVGQLFNRDLIEQNIYWLYCFERSHLKVHIKGCAPFYLNVLKGRVFSQNNQ